MQRYRPRVVEEMRAVVGDDPAALFAAMRYHLGWEDRERRPSKTGPGKMLRSTALLLSAEASGGSVEGALPAAAAVELVHNFSLLHDDVEDGSELRRGRAALWTFAGSAHAINAGDGMFTLARLAMHRLPDAGVAPAAALEAMRELDRACLRLVEGQHLDIAFEARAEVGRDEYLAMIAGKTAALFAGSAAIGALLAGAAEARVAAFREWGRRVGLAFQAVDDLLGIWGDPAVTGKPAGDDLAARKQTFPVVAALASGAAPQLEAAYRRPAGEPLDAAALTAEIEAAGGREATEGLALEHRAAAREALDGAGLGADERALFEQFAALATSREA
jgi:geranylgeranyl diphosphate synthase type I